MMRLPLHISNTRRPLALLLGLVLLFILSGAAWRLTREVQSRLDRERERLARENLIPFEKSVRAPLSHREQVALWQSTRATRGVARFQDSYFAATDGGLVQYSLGGNFLRHYTVLDGLPESDLTSLTPFGAKLYVGTRTRGLVAFDGERFESYRWPDRQPQAIAALLEDAGRLLIGTTAGGLIEFDGRQFREIKIGPEKARLTGINSLAKDGARLYVGTYADGLWIEEAARWLHFKSADGLASDRVVAVVAEGENLFVASDYGVAAARSADLFHDAGTRARQPPFQSLAVAPTLSGMVIFGERLIFCLDDGRSFWLPADADPRTRAQVLPLPWERRGAPGDCRLSVGDGQFWMACSDGLRRADFEESALDQKSARLSLKLFNAQPNAPAMASNLISALAFDEDGRLWAGSFRNGIDILSGEGAHLAHLESETTREINYLLADSASKRMLAATSAGLLSFDMRGRAEQRTGVKEGLLSNSVMHVALVQKRDGPSELAHAAVGPMAGSSLALATGKGLSVGEQSRLRALTTVQGLPSNSLYAVLSEGPRLYAGTLAGLAQIEGARVVRVFKDSNSGLTHNWVTALRRAGGRLFVGTYGGGVFELTAAGEMHSFARETGKESVNPNAMWSDDERLYVGTLDGAWAFNLRSQRWTHLQGELPSQVVLSINGDARHVFFGTTGGIARIEKSYLDRLETER